MESNSDEDENAKLNNLSYPAKFYDAQEKHSLSKSKEVHHNRTVIAHQCFGNNDQITEMNLQDSSQVIKERNDTLKTLTHNNFTSNTTSLESKFENFCIVSSEPDNCNLCSTKDSKRFQDKHAIQEIITFSVNTNEQICSGTTLKNNCVPKLENSFGTKINSLSKTRDEILKKAEECSVANLKRINAVKRLISNSDPASEFIVKNLKMQQKMFESFVENFKISINSVEFNSAENILKKLNLQFEIEQMLFFQKNIPAYGFKNDILNAVKENQIVIIPSDCSYFFNIVTPIIVQEMLPTYSIIFCESNSLAIKFAQIEIKGILENGLKKFSQINYVSDKKFLNILSSSKSLDKFVAIVNIPLKRSIDLDLSIAFLRDILHKQENSKLILLTSIFDNTENFKEYFLSMKTFILYVPKLLQAGKTVWKKYPSKNFKEDIVNGALAVHKSEAGGNILAFLPNESEAELALKMFDKKIQELKRKIKTIEGVLLDENSEVSYLTSRATPEKRLIFFTTHVSESVPMKSIRYIIDCGLEKDCIGIKNNFDSPKFCSRAKAELRKSLCCAFINGICYRMYSKEIWSKDMPKFEQSDFFINPFGSLIKVFEHKPEDALSVELIESCDNKVKCETIEQLKKINAIQNGKLTPLGTNILMLPLPIRYSKMIFAGIDLRCAYETVILVAYFSTDLFVFKYSEDEEKQRVIDAAKLKLLKYESDILSFLNIFKIWIQNESSEAWCDKFFINWNTLCEISNKVSEILYFYQCIKVNIHPVFNECDELIYILKKLLLESFSENFCVFSGHYKSGYRILSSSLTAFIHQSSLLYNNDIPPRFIIFNKIINYNFLVDITAFPLEFVQKIFTNSSNKILDYNFSDIFQKTLVSKTIKPVRKIIVKQELLGENDEKLREIEDFVKTSLKTDSIVIEPCIEQECVCIYALEKYLNAVVDQVDQILKHNLNSIINAEQVYILELQLEKIVVPILLKYTMGAKIASFEVKDTSVEFHSNQDIRNAEENCLLNVKSCVQCSLTLTWVRRPCDRKCYISFSPNDFEKGRLLSTKSRTIFSNSVSFQVCPDKDCTLFCSGVPPEARPKDIKEELQAHLPNIKGDIEMIFNEQSCFESTLEDVENMKKEIDDFIKKEKILSSYEIEVPKPENVATIWTAHVRIFCTENLTSVAEKLSNALINGYKVDAQPKYISIINTSHELFNVVALQLVKNIDELKRKINEKFPNEYLCDISIKEFNDKSSKCIVLSSNNISVIKQLQRLVNELLEGEILDKKSVIGFEKLFCHAGLKELEELQRRIGVYILKEPQSKRIRIYEKCIPAKEERERCKTIIKRIVTFLEDILSDTEKTISLGTANKLFLKAIIKEYGVNLNNLVDLVPKLRSARLDISANQLLLHGSSNCIEKVQELLKKLSSSLDSAEHSALLKEGEICPVCGRPALNSTYRLLHCNHLYCKECIMILVTQAKIPLKCCAENCLKEIVPYDIIQILDEDDNKIKLLLQASLDSYLEQNEANIVYCPTPACSMFFNKNDVTPRFKCPLCLNEICTKCNVVFHFGYTCDKFQGLRTDSDYAYKVWKPRKSEQCSYCLKPMKRISLFEYFTCVSCEQYYCLRCKQYVKSGINMHLLFSCSSASV